MSEGVEELIRKIRSDEKLQILEKALEHSFQMIKPQFILNTDTLSFKVIEGSTVASEEISNAICTYIKLVYDREIGLINLG